jgi:hypothetical protein
MFRIYPYKMASQSARRLRDALNGKLIKLENSRYIPRENHTIINWGNSNVPAWEPFHNIVNEPEMVGIASNKLTALGVLHDESVPAVDYTDDSAAAQEWLNQGHRVYARHQLNGHSGEGIEVIEPNTTPVLSAEQEEQLEVLDDVSFALSDIGYNQLASQVREAIDDMEPEGTSNSELVPEAPLYTKGINARGEYRVHVVNGEVILYQKKSRRVDEDGEVDTPDEDETEVRNLETGWVYRTGNLRRLERVEQLAIQAVDVLGLNFGAVDIIMDTNGDVFVLEVNTAPGLGNEETLNAYVEALNVFAKPTASPYPIISSV